jgi:hypothetical protein
MRSVHRTVRGVQCQPPEFEVGYLKELPPDYTDERHIVTVGRDADSISGKSDAGRSSRVFVGPTGSSPENPAN